jgi:hypothetical protein
MASRKRSGPDIAAPVPRKSSRITGNGDSTSKCMYLVTYLDRSPPRNYNLHRSSNREAHSEAKQCCSPFRMHIKHLNIAMIFNLIVGMLPDWAVCPCLVWTLLVYNWPWLFVDIILHVPYPRAIEVGRTCTA